MPGGECVQLCELSVSSEACTKRNVMQTEQEVRLLSVGEFVSGDTFAAS